MADPQHAEDYHVPGGQAARVAVLVPVLMLTLLSIAFWIYHHSLRPERFRTPQLFPAPGLETYVHPGAKDDEALPRRTRRDPRIVAAMHAVARDGLPGWPAGGAR